MIDLDALKAAGLNSHENSERLLAEHRAREVANLDNAAAPPEKPRKDFAAYLEANPLPKVD